MSGAAYFTSKAFEAFLLLYLDVNVTRKFSSPFLRGQVLIAFNSFGDNSAIME